MRASLRAERAVQLRAEGLTYAAIAAEQGEDGAPLYSSRMRAQEAVQNLLLRGATVSAEELLRGEPIEPAAAVDVDQIGRTRRDLLTVLATLDRYEVRLRTDQRGALAAAAVVLDSLVQRDRLEPLA